MGWTLFAADRDRSRLAQKRVLVKLVDHLVYGWVLLGIWLFQIHTPLDHLIALVVGKLLSYRVLGHRAVTSV